MMERPTTSIVCGVMDRLEHLRQSVPTWLACPGVDEVVVVDWSSRPPVAYEDLPADPRIRIARVAGQERWVLSKCCNLGLRLATGGSVLRLDADDLLDPMFVGAHEVSSSTVFYYADPRRMLREEDVHLSGVVYAARHVFFMVNGYNERLLTYGCDDDDLVARLKAAGISPMSIDFGLISHVPHSNDLRTANQVVDPTIKGGWTCGLGPTYRSIEENRRKMVTNPWTTKDTMARWRGYRGQRYLMCVEAAPDLPARFFDEHGIFMVDNALY